MTNNKYALAKNLAKNPNTPVKTLIFLSKDENFYVRYLIAINPNTPPKTLITLSQDKDWFVRSILAKNPNYINKVTE